MEKKLILIFILFFLLTRNFYAISAKDVLYNSDKWRGYENSFVMQTEVIDYNNDSKTSQINLKVYVNNISSSLAQYIYPVREKGKLLLMVNEDMWFYQPNLDKPVRISPRQRLLGNASNADIVRTNFYSDYIPSFLNPSDEEYPKEKDQIADINKKNCIILRLMAKNESVAYAKIIYWINKLDYKPIKAEFYALSGRLLKTAYYQNYAPIGENNEIKLSKTTIYNPLTKNDYTEIIYTDMREKPLEEKLFNVNYLKNVRF